MSAAVHRPDTSDTSERWADRCVCGAEIVFYDPPLLDVDDIEWHVGYGCARLNRPTRAFDRVRAES